VNPNQRSIETHLQCVVLWKTIFLGLRFASPPALNDEQLRCSRDHTLACFTSTLSRLSDESVSVRANEKVAGCRSRWQQCEDADIEDLFVEMTQGTSMANKEGAGPPAGH
jgi:hypothetical protein